MPSPLMQRRGLKPGVYQRVTTPFGVASHAEAWIETNVVESSKSTTAVASHAEAWIETWIREAPD